MLTDDSGFVLSLNNFDGASSVAYPGGFHVGFMQEGRERVDDLHRRLHEGGFHPEPPREFHGAWTFYFTAPGGFVVEVLHQPGAGRTESTTPGQERKRSSMLTGQTVASTNQSISRHRGPNPGAVAVVFAALFMASLVPVTILSGKMRFPSPLQPAGDIISFFRAEFENVRLCGVLQFASAIPLGIFTATMVSRLRFLGVNAAGPTIALFGGLAAALSVATSGIVQWTLSQPGIAEDAGLTRAFYLAAFGIGGPGYSVPLGLLIAGLSVPSFLLTLLPRWLCVFGLVLTLVGELSTLCLLVPDLLYLVPLTRFPGFLWLIVAGFLLPNSRPREVAQTPGSHGP